METIEIYSDAQQCRKSKAVIIGVRAGCPCGCKPIIGAIKQADWFKGLHGDQAAQQRLFTPASELTNVKLTCSREIDIYALKTHLAA